jgi:hypothetical protein
MRKALLLLALVAGCDMYWGNGDDVVCNKAYEAVPQQGYVDPTTGSCEYIGGGGYCDNACGPCEGGADIAVPDWPTCSSQCSGLDQTSCEASPGCHADFQGGAYWQCVAVAPTGPTEGGGCNLLDAQGCSEHDDCVTNYSSSDTFSSCAPENTAYCLADSDCSSGQRCDTSTCYQPNCPPDGDCASVCEGVCVPDQACTNVDCGSGYHCEETCYPCDTTDGTMCPPDDSCTPSCVPDQTCADIDCGPGYSCAMDCSTGTCFPTCVATGGGPGDCTGQVLCNSAPPACPANTTPGIANGCYTGFCIPVTDCGPHDPGLCYGQVTCTSAPPSCPMGTLPGVTNGCYSGYCIPTTSCEVPACETLTTEAACTSRNDCNPVYSGTNCTCDSSGCTCQTLTFERCESALMPL